jgi:hypothetical protein
MPHNQDSLEQISIGSKISQVIAVVIDSPLAHHGVFIE